jgi:multidrug efflux system membrane fusion protein
MKVPVTEGQDVKQGDVLAIIDPRPYQALVDAAVAKKRQDEAQLGAAKADLARYSALAAQEVASKQKLESTQALVGQITATIAADDAQIDAAKLNLTFCYITAPFDGRVGLRQTDPGNFVRAAEVTPVLPLSQLRPISVTFTVPQDNLPAIQRAMAAGKPTVTAFSSDDKTELDRGALLTIDNAIDPATGTIKIKATFPNQSYQLWPGQFINARLLIGTSTGVLTVPSAAVRHGQDRLFVFVVKPDQTVARLDVTVDSDNGVTAVISKGLEEGQLAVIDGHSRLQVGSHISIVNGAAKQAANPPQSGG